MGELALTGAVRPCKGVLPVALRAQIISLCMFVNRHTSAIMQGTETFVELIEVNRIVMQGLAPPTSAA